MAEVPVAQTQNVTKPEEGMPGSDLIRWESEGGAVPVAMEAGHHRRQIARCRALTRAGKPCKNTARPGSIYCQVHQR